MKDLPDDIINILISYFNIYDLNRISLISKNFNKIIQIKIIEIKKKIYKIFKLFIHKRNSFYDLRNLNRNGYLINSEKLFKDPSKYQNKMIQFVCKFQYHPYNVPSGEVGEGYLIKNTDDTWNIDVKSNSFDNDGVYFQFLFKPFILSKSLRVIKKS